MIKVNSIKFLLFTLFVSTLFSCATSRERVRSVKSLAPVITLNKLLKNIDTAENNFDYLTIKKLDVEMNNGYKKQSFKASLKMKSNEFIQISVNAPLGIEVLRVLLKQDSFAMINYHEKYYVKGDYDDFSAEYGIDLNYDLLQRIFTNKLIVGDIEEGHSGTKLERSINSYYITSEHERNLDRKYKKYQRKRSKNKEYSLIFHKSLIDSKSFRVLSSYIEDVDNESSIEVKYSDFNEVNTTIFPMKLAILSIYEDSRISVDIEYSKVEFDIPSKISFKIPSKYSERNI